MKRYNLIVYQNYRSRLLPKNESGKRYADRVGGMFDGIKIQGEERKL